MALFILIEVAKAAQKNVSDTSAPEIQWVNDAIESAERALENPPVLDLAEIERYKRDNS